MAAFTCNTCGAEFDSWHHRCNCHSLPDEPGPATEAELLLGTWKSPSNRMAVAKHCATMDFGPRNTLVFTFCDGSQLVFDDAADPGSEWSVGGAE